MRVRVFVDMRLPLKRKKRLFFSLVILGAFILSTRDLPYFVSFMVN